MTDWGFKVSNVGDVKTAAIKDMALHSEHYGIKIAKQASTTFSVTSGSGGSKSVAHGMGYTPGFIAFCKMTGSKYYPPSAWNYEGNYEQFLCSTDGTNINFSIDSNASSNYTATVYYFILVDPAQPTSPASGVASNKNWGIKVSKPGVDVKTAEDTELVFSSKFDTFRVFSSGIGSFTANGAQQTHELVHSLGYTPAFFIYSEVHAGFGNPSTGDFYMMPHSPPASIGGSLVTDTIIVAADTTKLYIRLGSLVVAPTKVINYKYVVFYNPIS